MTSIKRVLYVTTLFLASCAPGEPPEEIRSNDAQHLLDAASYGTMPDGRPCIAYNYWRHTAISCDWNWEPDDDTT